MISGVYNSGHYTYYIDDFAISKRKTVDEILIPYAMYDGTSMATPFVTAAAGVLSNLYGNDTTLQRKNRVLTCTRKAEGLDAKVITGGVLDLSRVNMEISEINISHLPNKLLYIKGEELDLAGGKIEVTFEDGIKQDLKMTLDMISGYDKDTLGKQTLYVNYKGKTKTFKVTVIKNVEKIEIKNLPEKFKYVLGEELDLTGGIIEVTYIDGIKEEVEIESYMISGYKNTWLGEQLLTVNYGGKMAEFNILLTNDIVDFILTKLPDKLIYLRGEELDLTGGKIDVVFENGDIEEQELAINMISGFDNNELGEQTLTISFKGKNKTFKVTVTKGVTKIEVTKKPTKVSYAKGEPLNIDGIEITATYEDGTTGLIELSADKFTGYDANKLGKQTITVTYGGTITTFEVTVIEKLYVEVKNYDEVEESGKKNIEKILPNTSIEELMKNIETNGTTVELYKGNEKITDASKLIGTGMEIVIKLNEEERRYTAVVTGDLIGDGKMQIRDLLKLARYTANIDSNLEGAYLKASDVKKDGKYGEISDILKMARVLAGMDNL